MTDIMLAKINLIGHTICVCKDGKCLYSDSRGISPILNFIEEGISLVGFSVADVVVGKAAAMLFVKCGVKSVYAKIISKYGKAILEEHKIKCSYETMVDKIINRTGTDMCPMEKLVLETDDIDDAYMLLKNEVSSLDKMNNSKYSK